MYFFMLLHPKDSQIHNFMCENNCAFMNLTECWDKKRYRADPLIILITSNFTVVRFLYNHSLFSFTFSEERERPSRCDSIVLSGCKNSGVHSGLSKFVFSLFSVWKSEKMILSVQFLMNSYSYYIIWWLTLIYAYNSIEFEINRI